MKKLFPAIAVFTTLLFAGSAHVQAQSVVPLGGFAWSSTIGWISMSCTNSIPEMSSDPNNCAANGLVEYGVQIESDGQLSGYAWSSNIGWIRFDPVDTPPSAPGNVPRAAEVVGTFPDLTLQGWARACSVLSNQNSCTGSVIANAGGWDGWISLQGEADDGGGYGITFTRDGARSDAYAWGSDVTGWISWGGTVGPEPYVVEFDIEDILIPSFSAVPNPSVPTSDGYYPAINFLAEVTGIPNGVTVEYRIRVTNPTASVPDLTGTLIGNDTGVNIISDTITNVPYNVTGATLEVDMPIPGDVTPEFDEVNEFSINLDPTLTAPPPRIILSLDRDVIRANSTIDITYSITAPYNTTCTLLGPGVDESIAVTGGVIGTVAGPTDVVYTTPILRNAGTYTISCPDFEGSGPSSEAATFEVIPTTQEI